MLAEFYNRVKGALNRALTAPPPPYGHCVLVKTRTGYEAWSVHRAKFLGEFPNWQAAADYVRDEGYAIEETANF